MLKDFQSLVEYVKAKSVSKYLLILFTNTKFGLYYYIYYLIF